jgi:hypothetical protein
MQSQLRDAFGRGHSIRNGQRRHVAAQKQSPQSHCQRRHVAAILMQHSMQTRAFAADIIQHATFAAASTVTIRLGPTWLTLPLRLIGCTTSLWLMHGRSARLAKARGVCFLVLTRRDDMSLRGAEMVLASARSCVALLKLSRHQP